MKEFKVRYIEQRSKVPIRDISDIQVILDFWSIHHVMIDAYTWIGTIIMYDETLGHELIDLIEFVEIFWHTLENKYPRELRSVKTAGEFNQVLKNLTVDQQQTIAMETPDNLSQKGRKYYNDTFEKILRYLKRNIPDMNDSINIRKKLGAITLRKVRTGQAGHHTVC